MEITIVDFLVVSVFISVPHSRSKIPFIFPMTAYFCAVLFSVCQSSITLASMSYCLQLLRMYFLYRVVPHACEDRRFANAVLKGVGTAVIVEPFISFWAAIRARHCTAYETVSAQNLLSMLADLVAFPTLALFLAKGSSRLIGIVIVSALIIAVSTGSRAAVGLGALGYATTLGLSFLREWTSRKTPIPLGGIVAAIVVGVAGNASLSHRTAAQMDSSDLERIIFEQVAAVMLADHPLGIGANQYVFVPNFEHHNIRAGVPLDAGNIATHVYIVYWLVAAETGYFDLATYVALLASCAWYIFRRALRSPLTAAAIYSWELVSASVLYTSTTYMNEFLLGRSCNLSVAFCSRWRSG